MERPHRLGVIKMRKGWVIIENLINCFEKLSTWYRFLDNHLEFRLRCDRNAQQCKIPQVISTGNHGHGESNLTMVTTYSKPWKPILQQLIVSPWTGIYNNNTTVVMHIDKFHTTFVATAKLRDQRKEPGPINWGSKAWSNPLIHSCIWWAPIYLNLHILKC